jgi:uncharacterized membrane protein
MKSFFQSIILREAVNKKRQLEIDITRGLAVLFMILVHVSGEFLDTSSSSTVFAKVVDFLGTIPAAPVFMFVMGVGFVYSKSQQPLKLFKRGLIVLGSGYVLNAVRGFIPFYIGTRLQYYSINLDGHAWYHYLVEVDILQFAGLAMIVVAILKAIRLKEYFYPLIAIGAGIVAPIVWGVKTGYTIVDVFLANIFGGTDYTFHPIFSWISYPLMGAFFGWLLIRCKSKNKFYLFSVLLSVIVAVPCLIYLFSHQNIDLGIVTGSSYNYFHHGLLSNLLFNSFIICWLAIWYFTAVILPEFIKNRLLFWSKRVTEIYFIHWIIIGWCSFLLLDTYNIPKIIILMVLLLFLSDRIAHLYFNIRERLAEPNETDIPAVPNN